jgi:antitoxin (DNA-binding transcriptional repressor) of toxin-antitoxin stability system
VAVEVGIRELRANLSAFVERVKNGEDVILTERGRPVARITRPGDGRTKLDELIARGQVTPAKRPKQPINTEGLPRPVGGTVVDILFELQGDADARRGR